MSDSLKNFLSAVEAERDRQDRKWGANQTHPDIHPSCDDAYDAAMFSMCPVADTAKENCEDDAKAGTTNWASILMEEVAESIEQAALKNTDNLRVELQQVAAVCAAWVNDLDNRKP